MNIETMKVLAKSPQFKKKMEDVFFDAMLAGYASSPQKGTIAELPGSKTILYKDGPWTVLDIYFITPLGNHSHGSTMIWYEDVQVWVMQYQGWYKKEAIPHLKAALRVTYEARQFFGGRGPAEFVDGRYRYRNNFYGAFYELSSGEEDVFRYEYADGGEVEYLGTHRYSSIPLTT